MEIRKVEGQKVLDSLGLALKKLVADAVLSEKCYKVFVMEEGVWGCDGKAEKPVGSTWVPWYGQMDPAWVNEWWETRGGGDAKALRSGLKTWRSLAIAVAVDACRTMWKVIVR